MNTQHNTSPAVTVVRDSKTAESVVHQHLQGLDHEEAWILYLTSSKTIICSEMVSKGTLTETSIDCRTVLRNALLHNAASLVLFHNHPSGDPLPSWSDIRFTADLSKACRLMDITLLDHIITSEKAFYSFTEEKTFTY